MAITLEEFVVKLGLDPTDLTKGQQQAMESWRQTQEESKKRATLMEQQNKAVSQSYRDIKDQVLGLIAVLVGAKDMSSFIGKTVTDLSSVGRIAVAMGQATPDLIAISMAVQRIGGDAQATQQSMLGLSQVMTRWRTFGIYPGQEFMTAMGFIGGNASRDTPLQVLQKFASWAEGQKDKQRVEMVGQQLGFNQDLINEAMRGRGQLDQDISQSFKIGIPSDQDIKKLQQLQSAWQGLGQALKFAATEDIVKVAPPLTDLLKAMTGLIDKFPEITGMVLAFGAAFLTWKSIATAVAALRGLLGLFGVGGGAAAAATAAGGAEATGAAAAGAGGLTVAGMLGAAVVGGIGLALIPSSLGGQADFEAYNKVRANPRGATDRDLQAALSFAMGSRAHANAAQAQYIDGVIAAIQAEWNRRHGPQGAGGGGGTGSTGARAQYLDRALATIGITGQNAEGVIAGLLAENPNLGADTKNPLSTARGLAQWTRSSGRQGLFRQIMGENLQGSSFEDQVRFLLWELTHTQGGAMRGVKGAGSASASALAFLSSFEAPGAAGLMSDMRRAQGALGADATVVQIGDITIYTQARDAKGIARDLKREIASQIPPNANGLN